MPKILWRTLIVSGLAAMVSAADPPVLSGKVVGEAGWSAPADMTDAGGRLTVAHAFAEARVFWRPHLALRIGLGTGINRTDYHDNELGIPEVEQGWLRLPVVILVSPHWGCSIQGSIGASHATEMAWDEGRQWQIQGGPMWIRDENLIISVLVNVSSQIGRGPSIFPFPSLYWRFSDEWRLTLVDEVDTISRLTWQPRDDVAIGLRADVRFREFLLTDGSALADDHAALAVETVWRPFANDSLIIGPFIGSTLYRQLTVRDSDGTKEWQTTVRPAFLAGLAIRGEF